MSGRGDIRMYVEHLFEGRTLDAETIELKEEIYGNLVARFDDYVAQGISEEEAYSRTCEAVTSVEDVLGEKGAAEKDERAADATVVMPEPAAEPTTVIDAPVAEPVVPPTVGATPAEAPNRWPTGKIVAVVAVAVVAVVAIWGLLNVLFGKVALDDYQTQTSQEVQQLNEPDDTTFTDQTQGDATDHATSSQTNSDTTQGGAQGNGNGNGNDNGAANGNGNGNGAQTQTQGQGATGLVGEVKSHSVDSLNAYAGTSVSDSAQVEKLFRSLPVSEYLSSVEANAATGTVTVTYEYQDRDLVARDDDHVDLALVYDAVTAMCTIDDLQTLTLYEVEPDDGRLERDTQVFERSMLERLLSTTLDGSKLTTDAWDDLRAQVMTEYIYDEAWDRADRD